MKTTITYRAINKTNGCWYVGSTQQTLDMRIHQHLTYQHNDRFHNSLRKHPNDWNWEVISECEGDDRSHEQYILDGWHGTQYCFNVCKYSNGGNGWDHISDEIRTENGKRNVKLMNKHPNTLDYHKKLSKPIKVTHIKSGVETVFVSLNEACRVLGLHPSNLSKVIRNFRSHKSCKGYTATYLEESE